MPTGWGGVFIFAVVAAPVAGDDDAIGEAAGVGEGRVDENHGRFAGEGDAAMGDWLVVAVASFVFERFCLAGLGEAVAAGDSAVAAAGADAEGDGDASLSFFLECFALAGLADAAAAGDSAAQNADCGAGCLGQEPA